MINILINFWYGKISLWKSYWIVGELINSLIVVLIYNYEIRLLNNKILYQELPFLNFDYVCNYPCLNIYYIHTLSYKLDSKYIHDVLQYRKIWI